MNTIELIKVIKLRPGMYIAPDSLESLFSFVRGFYFARSQNDLLDKDDIFFSENFYPWLKEKYSLENAQSWAVFIKKIAEAQGRRELEVFFTEFDKFLSEK